MKQYCQTPRAGWEETGEDTIIDSILSQIGLLRAGEIAVEFGAWDGFHLSNVRHLKERHGFELKLFDGDNHGNDEVIEAWLTPENVNKVLRSHGVPDEPAIISIDIDGYDYWIRKAMTFRPALYVMEFNGTLEPTRSVTVPYDPNWRWKDGDGNYFGASWSAIRQVNEEDGYVYWGQCACLNAFFIRADLVTPNVTLGSDAPPPVARYHRLVRGEWADV